MGNIPPRYKVSAVVCTRNRCGILARCLESLVGQDLPPEDYEIVVVDNGSRDATSGTVQMIMKSAPGHSLVYVCEGKPGLSASRNTGIARAHGAVIAFIDDDALASKGWLRELLEVYARHGADIVGGKVILDYQQRRPAWLGDELEGWLSRLDLGSRTRPTRYPEELVGTNVSFRADRLREEGGFDTGLGRKGGSLASGADTEILWRLERKGARAYYAPGALVTHVVDPGRLKRRWFLKRAYHGGRAGVVVRVRFEGRADALSYIRCTLRRCIGKSLSGGKGLFRRSLSFAEFCGCVSKLGYIFFPLGLFFDELRKERGLSSQRKRFYLPEEIEAEIESRKNVRLGGVQYLGHTALGRSLKIYFKTVSPPKKRLAVFSHLYPESPEILPDALKAHGFFNLDHRPAVPTNRWKEGMVFIDEIDMRYVPGGRYLVRFGLFDEGSFKRVSVGGADDDSVDIGWIRVG